MSWHITFWSLVSLAVSLVKLAEAMFAVIGLGVVLFLLCISVMHKRQSEMDAHRGDYDVL